MATYRLLATEVTIINPSIEVIDVIDVSPTRSKVAIKVGLGSPNNPAVNFETVLYGFDHSGTYTDSEALAWAESKLTEYEV